MLAGQVEDDLDILPAGMEDLEHILVVDQQVRAAGVRSIPSAFGSIAAASSLIGDLEQAQVGPIGVLAHELGVDRDEVGLREPFAQLFEGLGVGNQSGWICICGVSQ